MLRCASLRHPGSLAHSLGACSQSQGSERYNAMEQINHTAPHTYHTVYHIHITQWTTDISHSGPQTYHTMDHRHISQWTTDISHNGPQTYHTMDHRHIS